MNEKRKREERRNKKRIEISKKEYNKAKRGNIKAIKKSKGK